MPTTPKTRTAEQRKNEGIKVIARFFQAFNDRDTKQMLSLLSDKHVDHTYFGKDAVKPEAIGRAIMGMLKTFPDWTETIDEIIPRDDGRTFVVRQTGRGTQRKRYMGADPTGKQIAASLITVLTIENGKVTSYRSQFPFTTPRDEPIIAATDLDEARAEQGGMSIPPAEGNEAFLALAEGDLDEGGLQQRRAELTAAATRCEALLEENMRRCQNRAVAGSLYCPIHQEPGDGGSFGAAL